MTEHLKAAALHPAAGMYATELRAGQISRREFLTRTTALGVSAAAAYGLIGLAAPAQAQDAPVGGILRCAMEVKGTEGIEKCRARKTGFQYHVDLHLEVNPHLTVEAAHQISGAVRASIRKQIPWVADVLVHIEPAALDDKNDG